jgi:hypothetical protein
VRAALLPPSWRRRDRGSLAAGALLSQEANQAIALKEREASQSCRIYRWEAMCWISNVRKERIDCGEH